MCPMKRPHLMSFGTRRGRDNVEQRIWDWVLEQAEPYPAKRRIHPLKPIEGPTRGRQIISCGLVLEGDPDDPTPTALHWHSERDAGTLSLVTPAALLAPLASHKARGALFCWPYGAERDFSVLIKHAVPGWLREGWQVDPLVRNDGIIGLVLRRHKHTWWHMDLGAVLGIEAEQGRSFSGYTADTGDFTLEMAERTTTMLERASRLLVDSLGVGLGITLGGTAIAALRRYMDDNHWLWAPPPLLVAICRAAGAYRGAYNYAERYRGALWQLDLRRAYTWCLGEPLPYRPALAWSEQWGHRLPGIYLCRVSGTPVYPVYLSTWRGPARGFAPGYWRGGVAYAFIPSVEWPGLRALGVEVDAGYGFGWPTATSFAPYVGALESLTMQHAPDTLMGKVAKGLGNTLYGKLGADPTRRVLRFSEYRPGLEWPPYVDPQGNEYPGLWEGTDQAFSSHQHVDVAAWVTALCRNRLYLMMAELARAGIRCPVINTDGLCAEDDPRQVVRFGPDMVGAWRLVDHDSDGIVATRNVYAVGREAAFAGNWRQTRGDVERLHRDGTLTARGAVRRLPWLSSRLSESVQRTWTTG